jgi:hypothetical protein
MEMRQPHSTITTGVRQPIDATREDGASEIVMTANLFDAENDPPAAQETQIEGIQCCQRRNSRRSLIATPVLWPKRRGMIPTRRACKA